MKGGRAGGWILSILVYFLFLAGVAGLSSWGILAIFANRAETVAKRYQRFLPRKLETTALLAARDNRTWVDYVQLIPPDICGGALFQLSAATVAKIEEGGLRFLDGAPQASAPSPNNLPAPWRTRGNWSETPVPADWHGDGLLAFGFDCINLPREVTHAIDQAAGTPGSFYSRSDRRFLLVMPRLRAVMVAFFA